MHPKACSTVAGDAWRSSVRCAMYSATVADVAGSDVRPLSAHQAVNVRHCRSYARRVFSGTLAAINDSVRSLTEWSSAVRVMTSEGALLPDQGTTSAMPRSY